MVLGDRFSFAVEHEERSMMYLYSGNLASLLWKSGNMLIREIKYTTEDDDANKNKTKNKRNMRFN